MDTTLSILAPSRYLAHLVFMDSGLAAEFIIGRRFRADPLARAPE